MHLPTHPPLGLAFAMCKHGAQNSSTMSGFGKHLLNFLLTFPDRDACGGGYAVSSMARKDVSTKSCYTKIARVNGALILH